MAESYATKDALSGVDGRVTTVSQTVNGLKVDIHGEDGESGIAATVDGLETKVSDNTGSISTLSQTVEGLETTVSGDDGLTTIIRQDSNGVTVGKKDENGNYTTSRSVVGSDGTFKVVDKDGRTLASYGSDIRLLPEPAPGTSTSKIYIAGGSVHNAGVIRGDFNTGDESGNLTISSPRHLGLSGGFGVIVGSGTPLGGIYVGTWVGNTSSGGDATIISAADAKNIYRANNHNAVFLPMNGDTNVSRDIQLTGWQDGGDGSLGVHTNLPNQTIRVNWLLVVGI